MGGQFFIAILKQGSVFGREITCEVIAIKCDPDDEALDEACTEDGSMDVVSCMTELQLQLLIICAAKQFLLKFVSVGRPVLTALAQAKARELEVAISRKAYDDAHKGVAEDVSRHGAAKQLTSRHANHQFEMDDYEGGKSNRLSYADSTSGLDKEYIGFFPAVLLGTPFVPLRPAKCV